MDQTVSWRELLAETVDRLARAGVDDAELSARRIVEEASGWDGAELAVHLAEPATEGGVAHLDSMVTRRAGGEPLQYVVGRWGFRMLDLMVDPRALIPRPETEEVAGWAIEEARRFPRPVVADLGTGTGAIGLSVATELAEARVLLTDVFDDALAVARANLVGTGRPAVNVSVHAGSWFEALPSEMQGEIHVIVSNPPYVCDDDQLPSVVADWEPSSALLAGADGLRDLRTIVDAAPVWLAPTGSLVLELDPRQADSIAARCLGNGFAQAEIRTDLSGRPRAVVARL